MAGRTLYKVVIKLASPEELYLKHQEEITAAPQGLMVLRRLIMQQLTEIFAKLRLRELASVPLGSSNVLHELEELLGSLLARIRRNEVEPVIRLDFAVSNDPGAHQRMVVVDFGRDRARLTVTGTEPKNGVAGFVREKGCYAAQRRARQKTNQIDHYTTAEFAQAAADEVLAVVDNTRIKGELGIDVRGMLIKPQVAPAYIVEVGEGVVKRETAGGKLELVAAMAGLVKTRYDGEGNLRFIGVERDLRLGEVGFRTGGHVMARGSGGKGQALDIDHAEFRSVPAAFEARTEGAIVVKELVQGKIYGTEVTAEMVNQTAGKYIVATSGGITINRSIQSGFLFAPEITVGNGRVVATLMNAHLHARNLLVGKKILLSGRNRLVLGDDTMRESEANRASCTFSGRNIFKGRTRLKQELAGEQRNFRDYNQQINKMLLEQAKDQANGGPPLARAKAGQALKEMAELDALFLGSPPEEEDALGLRITNVLFDLGMKNILPVIRLLTEKKKCRRELDRLEAKLAEMTQMIRVDLDLAEFKDGALLTIHCWHDELLLRVIEGEILIERPARQERVAVLPASRQSLLLTFDYQSESLQLE